MEYAFAFAVIVILFLVVDRYRQERRHEERVERLFKQAHSREEHHERMATLYSRERERMDRDAQRERSLLLARETNPTMVDGAAVAAAMVERYQEQGVEKLHVSPDDDEGWAALLREQREMMERETS